RTAPAEANAIELTQRVRHVETRRASIFYDQPLAFTIALTQQHAVYQVLQAHSSFGAAPASQHHARSLHAWSTQRRDFSTPWAGSATPNTNSPARLSSW